MCEAHISEAKPMKKNHPEIELSEFAKSYFAKYKTSLSQHRSPPGAFATDTDRQVTKNQGVDRPPQKSIPYQGGKPLGPFRHSEPTVHEKNH